MSYATTANRLPRTMAHRGLSAHLPENTLSAVRAAKQIGCDWVELDVQLLGDGTPVIWHDNGVRRCSDGRGKLVELDIKRAQTLDVGSWFNPHFAGERMATLATMLELINELDMSLNLELKVYRERDPRALANSVIPMVLAALPSERLLISSFNRLALEAARDQQPDKDALRIGLLYEKTPREWQRDAETFNAFALHVDWRKLKERRAREIKEAGYSLLCYTPNDPIAFKRQWAWGVDSAISDDPALFEGYLPDDQPILI